MPDNPIRVVVLNGSPRPDSFTGRAVNLVMNELHTHNDIASQRFDVAQIALQLPAHDHKATKGETSIEEFKAAVNDATGVVLATPEYHGSFSAAMKLAIENLEFPSALAGKPVALLGVAAGRIGAVKSLEHLRSVCSHVGAMVLPGPISIAQVQNVFNDDGSCKDAQAEKQIRSVATSLVDFIRGHICPRLALEDMVRRTDPS